MNKQISILLAALIGAPLLVSAQQAQEPPPVPVEVVQATQDRFSASLWVPGTVISRNDARISAEVAGRLTWVAEPGTRIDKDQPLATIDDGTIQLELADSEARIRSLQAQLEFQQSQLARLQQLARNSNASATQIDEAKSQLEIIRQNLSQAEVARDQAKRRIEQSKVLAPFAGQVVERVASLGEFVSPGTVIARLVDTDHKEIRARAPLSVAAYISEGLPINVTAGSRETWSEITTIIPVGDERSRMFEVRLAADAPEWIVGTAVRVGMPNSEPRELIAIHRDALIMRGDSTFVYRINTEGSAERVDVRTGIGLGNLVEIIGEVHDGDQLITRGAERLQPGQRVSVAGMVSG